jgi:D-alanyl-D-alanine carboxypeptidase
MAESTLTNSYVAAMMGLNVVPASATALAERFDARIAPYFRADTPGATVIVTRDGKTVFRKAYGMADLGAQLSLNAGMALRLGSITKQFTAAAILMLAEQAKLALCDDFRKYLPDFPDKGATITIEHLLTHSSGIPSYTDDPGYMAAMEQDMTVVQMIARFKDAPLAFAPGERFEYNNSGYFLLGVIIEKISGKRYADFLAQTIFEPLGMKHTAYEGAERNKVVQALGYRCMDGQFSLDLPLSMSQPYAAGSLVSTVDDLARWDAAITAGRLLKPASWQRAFTPYRLNDGTSTGYGYGWEMGELNGSTVLAHDGGINGFATYAMRLPDEKLYVAVLSNSESGLVEPDVLARQVATIAIGAPH